MEIVVALHLFDPLCEPIRKFAVAVDPKARHDGYSCKASDAEVNPRIGDDGGKSHDGKVAMAAGDFAERDGLAPDHRKAHGDNQLVWFARRGQYILLKVARAQDADSTLGSQHHFAIERGKNQWDFRARISMGDRAAHRAPVARLEVADERQRSGKERQFG